MFGLGFSETGIVLVLGYLAFRHFIIRRYPSFYRMLDMVLVVTVALVLIFGLIGYFRGSGPGG